MTPTVPDVSADELFTSVLSARAKVESWTRTLKGLEEDLAVRLMADAGVTPGVTHVRAVYHDEPKWLVTGGCVLFPENEELGQYLLRLDCRSLVDNRLICTIDWEVIDA